MDFRQFKHHFHVLYVSLPNGKPLFFLESICATKRRADDILRPDESRVLLMNSGPYCFFLLLINAAP